ncbi:MAG: hypothetical protein KGQ41_01060 [Alphaproteobacteria bacterium]|nr:hypothetical protein [Alphaproteobacteria bacterium]
MKKCLLTLGFLASFVMAPAWSQESASPPLTPQTAVETEEQMVRETICPAMQNDDTYKSKATMFYKKIVAGDDGWVFRTITDFRTDFQLLPKSVTYMKQLQRTFEAQGIKFVYLIPPTRGIANGEHATGDDAESKQFQKDRAKARANYQSMINLLKGEGLNVIGFPDLTDGKAYFYKRDHHWNPEGAKLAAQRVADFLKGTPVYPTLAKTSYVTKDKGAYDYTGPFGEIVQPICKLYLMAEQTNKFETEISGGASDDKALFDEKPFPEVVLVGTSNSAADPSVANFEGFLKEALQTDIYNVSIIGAGIDTPLLAYLNSKAFREHKPKVIIWETPGYYDMNVWHSRIYRQGIPAVIGDCAGSAVAEQKAVPVTGNKMNVLQGIAGKKIEDSPYYASIQFSKPVKKAVTITFNYRNWNEEYRINRSPRYTPDGSFYMNLKDANAGPLTSLSIQAPADLGEGVTMDVRICKMPAGTVIANEGKGSGKKSK